MNTLVLINCNQPDQTPNGEGINIEKRRRMAKNLHRLDRSISNKYNLKTTMEDQLQKWYMGVFEDSFTQGAVGFVHKSFNLESNEGPRESQVFSTESLEKVNEIVV
jgi:hypothetical protein